MDFSSPDPSRVRLVDAINSIILLAAIISIGASTYMSDGVGRDLSINLGAGLLAVPVIYFLTRYFLFDTSAPRVETFFGSSDRIFEIAQHQLRKLSSTPNTQAIVRIYAPDEI